MRRLTLRGFDPELERLLRHVARSRDLSLDKAALYLMRKGAGLEQEDDLPKVGNRVDHLIGIWSQEDEDEFRAATRGFEEVDDELWA